MPRKASEFKFKDAYKGHEMTLKVVPVEKLSVISWQRKPSEAHVKHLVSSMERIGYLVPVIVVPDNKAKDTYLIIDGQHRFLAAKRLGIEKLPVIIVPEEFSQLMMNFNIEKELNIREKAYVGLSVYRDWLEKNPDIIEQDPEIFDSIENAHYVTLGLGYEKDEKLVGSALERILKKCDFFLDKRIADAYKEREERAERVVRINSLMKEISEKLKEMEKWHPYVYAQIISWANPYKRKRIGIDFEDMISQVTARLEEAVNNPEEILKHVEFE
ncbi:MAG: hypothetical protein DRI36_03885 [Caldiserica bacterium]|nr:MAG: hypothetical protein DRI36_03885 [Caldisericota bacterium]